MRSVLKAAALLALLAAAAASAAERITRTTESCVFDEKTTAKKRIDLPVPGAGTRVRLRLRAVLREGEAKFLVRDAEGRVRQDVLLRPRELRPRTYDADTGVETSPAGEWTVEVELRDAKGSYELTWTAE